MKEQIRLTHFTSSMGWRGHEQMIIDIYESLKQNNFVREQFIICLKGSEIFRVATEKNLNVIALEKKNQYSLSFAKKLKVEIEKSGSTFLFLHNSKAHTAAVLASKFFGLKMPMFLFRTMIKDIGTNYFRKYKYNYKGITRIICISDPVADILKKSVNDHSRLRVIGSVVDTDKFINGTKNGFLHKEFNIPADYKIIGNISAFCKVKDHVTWVNTVKILKERELKVKYILIGDGSLEQQIKEQVCANGLENEVIFAGFRTDVEKCLPEFDLFLFTSMNEATGGVILESYACKVPVVASNAGGIPTVVIDNETGLLAKVGNPEDFADKVQMLIDNDEMKEKFVKNGFEFLMNTSTRYIIGEKISKAVNEVVF